MVPAGQVVVCNSIFKYKKLIIIFKGVAGRIHQYNLPRLIKRIPRKSVNTACLGISLCVCRSSATELRGKLSGLS